MSLDRTKMKLTMKDVDDKAAAKRQRAQAAQERSKQMHDGIMDAWRKIAKMKNSESDTKKLKRVYEAMMAGEISRDPSDAIDKRGKVKAFSKAEALRLYAKLEQRDRDKKIAELLEKLPQNYELIQTWAHLDDFIAAMSKESIIALDTETTGLDVFEDEIVGISITLPSADRHCYIPVAHDTDEPQLNREIVMERLRPYLQDNNLRKVLHNAKFDIHMFIRHGVRVQGVHFDTQVAMQILNENEPSKRLKDLATVYLGEPSDTYDALFGKTPFHKITNLRVALAYAAKDTHLTWRLYRFMQHHLDRLPKLRTVYYEIENPLIDVVVEMEQEGFILDIDRAKALGKQMRKEIEELEAQLEEHFGIDVNFNSPAQLSRIFYEELKLGKYLPPGMKQSTDKNALKILAEHHEGISVLLEYKALMKLYGTYIDALPKQVKSDGRIHGEFKQDSTVTGRFSSKNPNLQNQPKYVRQIFKAPPGMVLLSGDFSQQEPRLLAHFSGEPLLIEAYRQGKDLYTTAAAELWGLPESECGDGSKWRKMMKTGILAVMYGTGTNTLAKQLGITVEEADDFIKKFYAKYKYVKRWIEGNVEFARKHGYVEMLMGRKRRLPEINSRDEWVRYRAERQATNAIIQGSAAIMTKIAMLKVAELCKRKGWKIVLTVHDEIGVYAPDTITPADVMEFEHTMLHAVELKVPSKSDIEAAYHWGESVNWDAKAKQWKVSDGDVVCYFDTPKEALAAAGAAV